MSRTHPLPEAPHALLVDGEYQTGVYRTPIAAPDLSARGLRRYRLKEWHYVSFTTDEVYIAVGLVQAGYVGSLFSYVVDRDGEAPTREYGVLSPMGKSLRFAPSSVRGTTTWKSRLAAVTITANEGWDVTLDIPFGDVRLRGQVRIDSRESLSMLHRLSPRQLAYTHKAAGWPASGQLELGARALTLTDALSASDWTRAEARRLTVWKWASLSGRLADGTPIGLNLSADVYDDDEGHSVENAFWLDGEVQPLSGVRFDVPASASSSPWRIRSLSTDEVDLEFSPIGAREEHTNFGLLRTDFVQPYGRFSGTVLGHDVTGTFGVVESHTSVW